MDIPKFAQEMMKYVATALIGFGASLLYTFFILLPTHNISLIPISISLPEPEASCTINKDLLKDAIVKSDPAKAEEYDTYEHYLRLLVSSPAVSKELVPPSFLPELVSSKVLTCHASRKPNAEFSFEAAALLSRPTSYVMQRSCVVFYGNVALPVRASLSDDQYDTFVVRDTMNLMFNPTKSETAQYRDDVKHFLDDARRHKRLMVKIKCTVIGDSVEEIEGHWQAVKTHAALF